MKYCPKCNKEHAKPGTYCSRSCANSRVFTEECLTKKSEALKGKPRVMTSEQKQSRISKVADTWKRKYEATPFDQLGMENRRRRVFEEQSHCCNRCGLSTWLESPITLELEHIDGNNQNNDRSNLEGLCPNCHSITDTWRGRNKSTISNRNRVSDDELYNALVNAPSIRTGLVAVGLTARGANYARARQLLDERNGSQTLR